jgi:hypothetical protein
MADAGGGGGGGDAPRPRRGADETSSLGHAVDQLGLDPHKASDALHQAKRAAGLRGDDNVWINFRNGDIRDPRSGEIIGSLFGN